MTKQELENRIKELKVELCDLNDEIGAWQSKEREARGNIQNLEMRGMHTVGKIMEVKANLKKLEEKPECPAPS